MDDYKDETFEEDDGDKGRYLGEKGYWKTISFDEIELGEKIGGGSVGLVHRGKYLGKEVALKTLVRWKVVKSHSSIIESRALQLS